MAARVARKTCCGGCSALDLERYHSKLAQPGATLDRPRQATGETAEQTRPAERVGGARPGRDHNAPHVGVQERLAACQHAHLRRERADAGEDAEQRRARCPAPQTRRVRHLLPGREQQREESEARPAQAAGVVGGAQGHRGAGIPHLAGLQGGKDHRAGSMRKLTAPPPTWPSAEAPRHSIL